ncbi:unnamed protein product [Durusdinium trenchii]|uniref:Uncharacterized protein n=1 Tax=Durusdinium trenchii TaxID=1381693 RepID=A0ABP0M8Z1_9DINO
MLVLIGLLGVWPCLVLGTHGPDGFSEVFTMPGASFKLELHGPGITSKDRAIIREAGTECPGRSDKADSNARKNSISVATYVYHAQGAYEPSPLVHSGPNVASANFPGWLTASWYPVQLRMAGSSRICYCAARAEEEAGSPMLNPNESPCDLDYAVYRLVGAAYAMGIKHSTSIGACMVLSDGTLQENCQLTIHADRGGLSAEDSADLVSGDPAQICGEAPAGTTLQPRQGDAFAWTFQVPSGATVENWHATTSELGTQHVLKVCYCVKPSASSGTSICALSDWQNAGMLSLVGFSGSPAEVHCYRGQRCRLGRPAFGMSKGDAVLAVPGNSTCSNVESLQFGASTPISVLGGGTAVAHIDVKNYVDNLATVCFCSAAVSGIFGCQNAQGRAFSMLMGYVRSGGLEAGVRMDCIPTSSSCPSTPFYLQGDDAAVARRGKLFLAELKYRPCEDLTSADVQQARFEDTGESVRVEMPWPIRSGRYAVCFCEDSLGCPQVHQQTTLQHVGELRVLGAITSVELSTQPGFSTVPLKVRIEEPATGIRCCADAQGINIDCVDLQASATPGEFLSSPGTFRFPLVLQEPLEISDDPLNVNVSCAAMGESGLCAQNGTGPELGTFPCRQVEPLQVQLKAQPLAWKPPWRIPVNSTLGLEALAEPAGYASQLKAVEDEETAPSGICKTLSSQHFHSLPCKGTECVDQDFARGQVPGHYELCVCEAEAVPMSLICQGWHHLGHLEVFGPLQLKHALHGSVGEAMHIDLDGLGFSSGDSLVSVPLDSELMRPETACIGEGRILAPLSTVHSPHEWSTSSLHFIATLSEGTHALCWLPPGNGQLPYYLGFAEIFGERITIAGCLVTPWELLQPCSAECGAGREIWYRRVLGVVEAGADCSTFEEDRFCMKPACPAVVSSWRSSPAEPQASDAMELRIVGVNLTNNLHGVLVLNDGSATSDQQGLCRYDSHVAAMAKCSGNSDEKVCSFPRSPSQGSYQVCLCMADGPKCQAFLPALGNLQILGVQVLEDESIAGPILICLSILLIMALVPLLLFPRLRKRLWIRLTGMLRKLCRRNSKVLKVMALPTKSATASEAEEDQTHEEKQIDKDFDDKVSSTLQPEEEPEEPMSDSPRGAKIPVCRGDRSDQESSVASGDDNPPHPDVPDVPEPDVDGCKTPEDLAKEPKERIPEIEVIPEPEPLKKSTAVQEEQKEAVQEEAEEAGVSIKEKANAKLPIPRPLPPPPLRSPPRRLPSLPLSPNRSPVSPAAMEALSRATMILEGKNEDGERKLGKYSASIKALSTHMAGQDATLLSQELVKAEAAGVGAELLEKAAEKLRELQETETPRADDEDEEGAGIGVESEENQAETPQEVEDESAADPEADEAETLEEAAEVKDSVVPTKLEADADGKEVKGAELGAASAAKTLKEAGGSLVDADTEVKSEGEVKELPAAGETPKGVHDTPLPSDDAEAAVQVTKVEILKTTSGSLVDADAEVKSDGEDNPPDADETAKGAHDDDSAVEAKDSDAPAKPEPDDETEEVTKVEILKTTSGSLVDAGAEVKSDGEDNPPDADETAKGAHDDDSAVEAVLFVLKVELSSTRLLLRQFLLQRELLLMVVCNILVKHVMAMCRPFTGSSMMRGHPGEDPFSLPKRPERPQRPELGNGVPKEKKKSTPIRPSLMGSTLIDGGTLMLWKFSRAKLPRAAPVCRSTADLSEASAEGAMKRGALHGLLDDIVKVVRAHVGEALDLHCPSKGSAVTIGWGSTR